MKEELDGKTRMADFFKVEEEQKIKRQKEKKILDIEVKKICSWI